MYWEQNSLVFVFLMKKSVFLCHFWRTLHFCYSVSWFLPFYLDYFKSLSLCLYSPFVLACWVFLFFVGFFFFFNSTHSILTMVVGGLVAKSCLTYATSWTVSWQAPLSMRFPRQEYWSVLPFPSPGDLPNTGIKPTSAALQIVSCIAGRFFTAEPP